MTWTRTHGGFAPLFAMLCALVVAGAMCGVPVWAFAEEDGNSAATSDTAAATSENASNLEIQTLKDTVGKKIGMINGCAFDQLLLKNCEGMSQDDFYYYNSNAETLGALTARKIDVMVTDLPIAQLAVNKNDGIGIIPEPYVEDHYGYVLQKNSDLTDKINERLEVYRNDGTIDALKNKWMAADASGKTMPTQDWDAPNGTLKVATALDNEPMNYQINNEPAGMCIELLELIARDLGYRVEYTTTNSGSLIAEVQTGKSDVAASSCSITDERKKSVDMTEPFYDGGVTAVVRTTEAASDANEGLLERLAKSFESTFITENRWQLILEGLGVTLLISIVSGAAGLVLGFLFVLLCRKREGGLVDKLIHALESLLGGLPVVVILMVFYYIFFGAIDISGIIVAILAFTLMFGATSGSIMWNAIRAVDAGQSEAGRALGFDDRSTFTLIVLPQAARQFAPLLLSSFVGLVKDTSIVGYIAVQDLTRVGDLIRARTMDAFFPLIAIAIIYFAICRLFTWLLGLLVKKLEPKEGLRTIKGVEL